MSKELVRVIVQKVLLVLVGLACVGTVVPFMLAIVESLAFAPTVSEPSILKTFVKKLFSKGVV
jgi:hypothetical protein